MKKRLFRGTRTIVYYEDVQVFADTYDEARELIEDDSDEVIILGERGGDYEISSHLTEVKE